MTGAFTIVTDCADHADAIAHAAFEKEYGSGDCEAALIAQLRADGDVVAELNGGALVGGPWKLTYPAAFASVLIAEGAHS